jgi:hypothetical protein
VAVLLQKTSPLWWPCAVPWHCQTGADFSGWQIARVDWMHKIFGRGRWRRCAVREKKEPSLLSFKGGREGAVSQMSPLMRWFETPVTLCTAHDLHAASSRQPQLRHVSVASAYSHGPLTMRVDACRWRAQPLLGAPDPSLSREGVLWARLPGATVGVLDTGTSQSTCC